MCAHEAPSRPCIASPVLSHTAACNQGPPAGRAGGLHAAGNAGDAVQRLQHSSSRHCCRVSGGWVCGLSWCCAYVFCYIQYYCCLCLRLSMCDIDPDAPHYWHTQQQTGSRHQLRFDSVLCVLCVLCAVCAVLQGLCCVWWARVRPHHPRRLCQVHKSGETQVTILTAFWNVQ